MARRPPPARRLQLHARMTQRRREQEVEAWARLAPTPAPRKRALIVGINSYARHPLRGCLNDVTAVRQFLEHDHGFAAADIATLCDAAATRAAIVTQLRAQAAATTAGDTLVFYFCGHGAQLPTEDPREADRLDEVLCPIDFDGTAASAIVDDELEHLFDSVPVGAHLTWVFDACHTGDLDEQLDARVAGYRSMPTPAGPAATAPLRLPPRPRPPHRGVILSACAAAQRAADIFVDGRPRGAFTYHLLAAARQRPGATTAEVLAATRRALAPIGQHPEGVGPGLDAPFLSSREPNSVKSREQTRTVLVSANPSVDADRHLHVYLAEASRLAATDDDFSAKLGLLGLDLSDISPGDAVALARAVKPAPRPGGLVCRTFWWGFHLEISHADLEDLARVGISHIALARRIEVMPHMVLPHLGTLVDFAVERFDSIAKLDRGAGVFISMSSFAPDLYVTTAVPVRAAPRRADASELHVVGL